MTATARFRVGDRLCPRCDLPLVPDTAVLEDARRLQVTLDVLPLRCAHGHTVRVPLGPAPRVRYVPTCGYCGEPVLDRAARGAGYLNHPACTAAAGGRPASQPHRYVMIPR